MIYCLILKNVIDINPRNHEGITLDMGWTPFQEAAVKDHLEICQRIMWSLGISNFTEFHPRYDKGLTNMLLDDL